MTTNPQRSYRKRRWAILVTAVLLISCCLLPGYAIIYLFAPYPAPIFDHHQAMTGGSQPMLWLQLFQESSDQANTIFQWHEARGYSLVYGDIYDSQYIRCFCWNVPHACLVSGSLISSQPTGRTELTNAHAFEFNTGKSPVCP